LFRSPSLHPVAQGLQQLAIRVAIRRPAEGNLRATDSLAGVGADDAVGRARFETLLLQALLQLHPFGAGQRIIVDRPAGQHLRSEEHTSELQSRENLVCRLLLEKKNT